MDCRYCHKPCSKAGYQKNRKQKFYCRPCQRYQQDEYVYHAYSLPLNGQIRQLLTEGMGLRGISRVLGISLTTVISRIKNIARTFSKPLQFATNRMYELDELWTFVQRKSNEVWIMYVIDRTTRAVIDFRVGARSKINLRALTDPLMMLSPHTLYTDGMLAYKALVPGCLHKTSPMGTCRIERHNLTLRTHLKRLSRKTICFSKSIEMLEACLRIYFWRTKAFHQA